MKIIKYIFVPLLLFFVGYCTCIFFPLNYNENSVGTIRCPVENSGVDEAESEYDFNKVLTQLQLTNNIGIHVQSTNSLVIIEELQKDNWRLKKDNELLYESYRSLQELYDNLYDQLHH